MVWIDGLDWWLGLVVWIGGLVVSGWIAIYHLQEPAVQISKSDETHPKGNRLKKEERHPPGTVRRFCGPGLDDFSLRGHFSGGLHGNVDRGGGGGAGTFIVKHLVLRYFADRN